MFATLSRTISRLVPFSVSSLGFPDDSSDFTFYHPPLRRFLDSRDVSFDESDPYCTRYPCRGLPIPPPPLFLTPTPPPAPLAAVDPEGAGVRAASGGVGVGAESVLARGSGAGGARVGAEPVSAEGSSLRGAGVCRAVTGGATTGGAGAPSAGPGEPGAGRVAVGGAGSRGGATGALESGPGATIAPDTNPPPHPYPTWHQDLLCHAREEQLGLERERLALERHQLELQQLEEQQQERQQEQQPPQQPPKQEQQTQQQQQPQQQEQQQRPSPPPVSGLQTLDLPSPSPPSSPSPTIYVPTFAPPDPTPAVFPHSQPPLSPPLSHNWASRSPHARPSSPVPVTYLLTVLFRSSSPRPSLSLIPSPPESALTASLPTLVTDYYRMYRHVLSRVLASLVTDPHASLSSVSAHTATVTEFAATHRLDYVTRVVDAPPTSPLAVGGGSALS
ncbi:unnamed protein product [Closterium sp. NIES-54]